MSGRGAVRAGGAALVLVVASLGAVRLASSGGAVTGLLVFTQVPVDAVPPGAVGDTAWLFPSGSRIVAVDPASAEHEMIVLTNGFHSARSPAISPDGKRMVFSARRTADEPWHIWEMRLGSRRTRQITHGQGSYTDPAYLGDGRVVFSGLVVEGEERNGFALYVAGRERDGITRITFHPGADLAPQVLLDGRVLFTSVPDAVPGRAAKLMIVRYDGTGAHLFYENGSGAAPTGRAWETGDGRVVFVELTGEGVSGGKLVSVAKRRPLHSRVALSGGVEGSFHSVHPLPSGTLVVSYRPPGGEKFAIYEYDPAERMVGELVAVDSVYHAVEPVIAAVRQRPKTFVSVVDQAKTTGEVYALDANESSLPPLGGSRSPLARLVRVRVPDGVLGEVPLKEDGSFYLELPADTPLRMETLDDRSRLVRGPSAWFWVRPNERRGCIGCHESRELAPENRLPLAVTGPPVSLASPRTLTPVAGAGRKSAR
ncbi:MAG: hypothetical protein ACE5PT_05305 [Gemmatimonadales bacterium]